MNPDDIPLKILICDPEPSSAELLRSAIARQKGVAVIAAARKITDAQAVLREGDFNTIFIDVIGLGMSAGADFVFSVRKALPEIVFTLFIDRSTAEAKRDEFYRGERSRFLHYYTLDKRIPADAFTDEVRAVLTTCRLDLSYRLSEVSLTRLRDEAVAVAANRHAVHRGAALATQVEEIINRVLAQKSPGIDKRSVFLSHRFAEKEYVEGLTQLLESEGFSVVTGRSANTYISQAVLQRIREGLSFSSV